MNFRPAQHQTPYANFSFSYFWVFSDSGFGGSVRSSSSKKDYDGAESPKKFDLDGLSHFEKNFYVESPSVAAMSERDVEEYRQRREITVEGRDVPKPVKSFRDVGFPGTCFEFILNPF